MKEAYIHAVLQLIATGNDPVDTLDGLRRVLQSRGHERLYGVILAGLERKLTASADDASVVYVASENALASQQTAINEAAQALSAANPRVVVDETLIGGFVYEANRVRIDASYKQALVQLFRSLTT